MQPKASGASSDTWLAYLRDSNTSTQNAAGSFSIDYVAGVAVDTVGNVYSVGQGIFYNKGGIPPQDVNYSFVSKHNTAGTLQWIKEISTEGTYNYGFASSVKIGPVTGNIYVGATITPNSKPKYSSLFSFSPSGTLNWGTSVAFGITSTGGYPSVNPPGCLIIDSSENIYFGSSGANGYYAQPIITKFDSSGTLIWQRTPASGVGNSSGYVYLSNMCFDGAGNIFCTYSYINYGSSNTASQTPGYFAMTPSGGSAYSGKNIDLPGVTNLLAGMGPASTSGASVPNPYWYNKSYTLAAAPFCFSDGTYTYVCICDTSTSPPTPNYNAQMFILVYNSSGVIQNTTRPYVGYLDTTGLGSFSPFSCGIATSTGHFILGGGGPTSGRPYYASFNYSSGTVTLNTFTSSSTMVAFGIPATANRNSTPYPTISSMALDNSGNIYFAGGLLSNQQYVVTSGSGKTAVSTYYQCIDAFIFKWRLSNGVGTGSTYSYYGIDGASTNFSIGYSTVSSGSYGGIILDNTNNYSYSASTLFSIDTSNATGQAGTNGNFGLTYDALATNAYSNGQPPIAVTRTITGLV